MADNLIYEMANMTESTTEPFVKKEVVYVIDQNNSSYNGQIQIETSSLSNSGKWANYAEAFLIVPLVVAVKSSADITGSNNAFMSGLKNGFHQLIDSIQVDYNGTNVVQLTPYTNFYVSYKCMTTFAQDDVFKFGSSINFSPDTCSSFVYSAAASATGNGVANNTMRPQFLANFSTNGLGFSGEQYNVGFLTRLRNTCYDPAAGFGGCYAFYTSPQATGKSYFTNDGGAGAARVYFWNILAKIRLKDICDFFDKLPLVKGAFIKMTVNTNTASVNLTTTNANLMSIATATDITIVGRTNPLLIPSVAANSALAGAGVTTAGLLYVSCGIGSATVNNSKVSNQILTSCRLYVPLYTMSPTYEDQYLTLNPTKEVIYRDLYNYNIIGVGAGSTFTQLLTNGITNPKAVVVIPMLNGSTAGNNATVYPMTPYQSPFATEPATSSPLLAIQNFNVMVSGINLFPQNQQYDFDQFLNELSSINAVNGGKSTGLTSGLIGEFEFNTGYRYTVADLSRRLPLDDSVPKSIQLIGVNVSTKIVDYFCFIEYQRSITIDLQTFRLPPSPTPKHEWYRSSPFKRLGWVRHFSL